MRIEWTRQAERDASKLPEKRLTQVIEALDRYAGSGEGDVKKLVNVNPPEYRLRVGAYRVRFRLDAGPVLLVLRVLPRGGAY